MGEITLYLLFVLNGASIATSESFEVGGPVPGKPSYYKVGIPITSCLSRLWDLHEAALKIGAVIKIASCKEET